MYEEERERFLIDGEVVATIEELEFTELENPCFNNGLKAAPKYTYLGSKSKKISWLKGVAVGSLAAIIAAAIGSVSAAAVIAKIGLASLSVVAAASCNAVIKTKIYSRKTGKITNYKYVWSFTPSGGSKYGDYTSYVTVD